LLATQPGLVAELARAELADIDRLTEAIHALRQLGGPAVNWIGMHAQVQRRRARR
jgi:hypothetical protein